MNKPRGKLKVAPKDYQGIEDLSDDYDISAKIINAKPHVKQKAIGFLAGEPNTRYGERNGYMKYGPKNGG